MADQELGQGARKHQPELGLGNEGIAQSLEPEPGLARFADGVVEVSTAAGLCAGAGAFDGLVGDVVSAHSKPQ